MINYDENEGNRLHKYDINRPAIMDIMFRNFARF